MYNEVGNISPYFFFLKKLHLFLIVFNFCLVCPKGFIGTKCDIKCPLPMYGQGCQSVCNCTANVCHHVSGCRQSSTSIISFFFPNLRNMKIIISINISNKFNTGMLFSKNIYSLSDIQYLIFSSLF